MLAATALVLGACSLHEESRVVVEQAITNGAADDGDPAVVALVDASGRTECTGTLVAPHVALTAAHCVLGVEPYGDREVLFGSDVATGTRVKISDVHRHPQFDDTTFDADIALLALASPAPAVPIAPLPATADAALSGASVTIAGFGATSGDAADVGRKRRGTATIDTVGPTSFTLKASPSQPCIGDSGGPAFLDVSGTAYVAGITSHGDAACVARDTETRVDAYADFVSAYVAATAEGVVGAGDRCYYEGHCDGGASCVIASDDPHLAYCAPSCSSSSSCTRGMTCVDGKCRWPPPTPGAIGSACATDADCIGETCDPKHVCSHRCVSGASDCPSGFACANVGGIDFYCMPSPPAQGGSSGCGVSPGGDGADRQWLGVAIAAVIAGVRRRRRRRALVACARPRRVRRRPSTGRAPRPCRPSTRAFR